MVEHEEKAMQGSEPQQGDGGDFGSEGDGALFVEASYVRAQITVPDQPGVCPWRTAHEQCRCQKQKRRGGQQGHEYADEAACQR